MRGVVLICCLCVFFFSSCKIQTIMVPDQEELKKMLQVYSDASANRNIEVYLPLTDESIFKVISKEELENKFKNKRDFPSKSLITKVENKGKTFNFSGNYYMLIESTADSENLYEGKTYDNKGNIIMISRDEGANWKFIPGKYFAGFGESANGVGLINKHPEVLPQEVWDHFYRKLDSKLYK